jgi:hypothetical protein
MARRPSRRWPYIWLPVFIFVIAQPAHATSLSTALQVTAQVADYCTFNSSAMTLISVWCSQTTPMVTSSSSTSSAATGLPQPIIPQFSKAAQKQSQKLCNTLEVAQLENDSFNQFRMNIVHQTTGPNNYYSTFNICF